MFRVFDGRDFIEGELLLSNGFSQRVLKNGNITIGAVDLYFKEYGIFENDILEFSNGKRVVAKFGIEIEKGFKVIGNTHINKELL